MIRTLALGLLLLVPVTADAAVLGPGEPLTAGFVEALVAERLDAEGLEIRIDEPRLPLGNPVLVATSITLEGFAHDTGGRFSGLLVGRIGEELRFRLPTRGRAVALVEVPVLSRPIAAGEPIAAGDLAWIRLAAERVPANAVLDAGEVAGAEARRRLLPGRILHARDLGPARLVRRGHPVQLVYRRPGLHLSMQGIARDDGAADDVVRVLNPASGREVQGLVSGPDAVTVAGPAG